MLFLNWVIWNLIFKTFTYETFKKQNLKLKMKFNFKIVHKSTIKK